MKRSALVLPLLLPTLAFGAPKLAPAPATPKKPVTDTYHGTKVVDPYQWLESNDDPKVKQWTEAQSQRARAYLEGLPERDALRKRYTELLTHKSPGYFALSPRPGGFFALKHQPPHPQPVVVWLPSVEDTSKERVLLDPVALDPKALTSIDFIEPSPDGKVLAVSLSSRGTESGDVHLYDVATGKELEGEVVPRVNGGTAGGDMAWAADGKGFYYTRYPREGERPAEDQNFFQQVYFHKLGTKTAEDTYVLGKEFPRIAMSTFVASEDSQHLAVSTANGDGGDYAFWLRGKDGSFKQIAKFEDGVKSVRFGRDGSLYLGSTREAPKGKLLRLAPGETDLAKATLVLPEQDGNLESYTATSTRLYASVSLGGPSELRVFDLSGKRLGTVPTPPVTTVGGALRLPGSEDVLVYNGGYLQPGGMYRYTPADGALKPTALIRTSPVDTSGYEATRVMATSKDGTQVPVNIIHKKGLKLDGTHPTLLTGYGGFGLGLSPGFSPANFVWLERGGVFAVANLRGGDEFGEEWHKAGNLTKKQNVFDDFAAAAQLLIDKGYTKPAKLAIEGGSNGGLLMGAAFTQHPKKFGAVVAHVGIYDMLRTELGPNGQFNITEYGTVKDPEQFKALHAYSPYHKVKDGTQYPPILFTQGDNDPRVLPWQSRKMTARLQASGTKAPVLLRTSSDAGHGNANFAAWVDAKVDSTSFLLYHLGVTAPQPKPAKPGPVEAEPAK
jgi:prolyl oligopeptidase